MKFHYLKKKKEKKIHLDLAIFELLYMEGKLDRLQ